MSISSTLRLGALAAVVLAASARAAEVEPGVWWEQSLQAEMNGMSMPATTTKVCVAKKGMDAPPSAGDDDRCKVTDVKHSGKKMTWKVVCSGPDAMTGEGEIVQGKDSFAGKMSMHMKQGDATAKMSGKLVGGDCDASAPKKQVAAMQKQAAEQQQQADRTMAQICEQAVDEMQLRLFAGPLFMCKDQAQAAKACARMGKRDGYLRYRKSASQDPELTSVAAKLCKKDPESHRQNLCTAAAREAQGDRTPDDVLEFLGENCPDETRALAKKECAGRSFTGMPDGFRKVCVQYAREELGGGKVQPTAGSETEDQGQAPAKKGVKEQAAEKGKSILKGLFK